MPQRNLHIAQAVHNERVAALLSADPETDDWQITVLSYAALHYFDAVLDPIQPRSHGSRARLVTTTPMFASIAEAYLDLRARSEEARYGALPVSSGAAAEVRRALFTPVRATLRSRMGLDQ